MTVYNVKDSHGTDGQGNPLPGAQGDGLTDDTPAIQRALQAASAGGVVFFPPGNYRVNGWIRDENDVWVPNVITLRPPSRVTIRGSGPANTRVFQVQNWAEVVDDEIPPPPPDNAFWSIFVVLYDPVNRVDIAIEDMTVDGGYDLATSPRNEMEPERWQHCHGVDIRCAHQVCIRNVRIENCAGDGVSISAGAALGTPPSTEVLIENCSFDTIWRIGVSLGRSFRNVLIQDCTFCNWEGFVVKAEHENAMLPDDTTLDRGLTVTRCTCLPPTVEGPANAGSISVYSPAPQVFRDVVISHNTLRGPVLFRGAHHVLLEGNTVLMVPQPKAWPALDLWGNTFDFTARYNTFWLEAGSGFRAWYGSEGQFLDPIRNGRLVFVCNTVEWISPNPPVFDSATLTWGEAVELRSAHDAVVEGNILRGAPTGAASWPVQCAAIRLRPRNKHPYGLFPVPHTTLTQNIIQGYPIGIQLQPPPAPDQEPDDLTDVIVTDNTLDGCLKGIELNQLSYIQRPALSGNLLVQPPTGAVALVWSETPHKPYLIAGLHGTGPAAVGFFVGSQNPDTSPEARIQNAAVGSLYLNSTTGWLWMREMYNGSPTWTHL